MFQISDNELNKLVTICDRFKTLKHSSSNPYAFTEQGVSMLASVLHSETAVQKSIKIIDAFIALYLSEQIATIPPPMEEIPPITANQKSKVSLVFAFIIIYLISSHSVLFFTKIHFYFIRAACFLIFLQKV